LVCLILKRDDFFEREKKLCRNRDMKKKNNWLSSMNDMMSTIYNTTHRNDDEFLYFQEFNGMKRETTDTDTLFNARNIT